MKVSIYLFYSTSQDIVHDFADVLPTPPRIILGKGQGYHVALVPSLQQ